MRFSWAIIFIFLFSVKIYSEDCFTNPDGIISCNKTSKNLEIGWWSASPSDIKNAKCVDRKLPTEEEIRKYFKIDHNLIKSSDHFYGIEIQDDDPKLISLLKNLTTFNRRYAPDPDGGGQKEFKIPPECKKVFCAAQHIFGKDLGPKYLYALDKYEINLSEFTHDHLDPFKEDEVDTILEAISDLPYTLMPFEKNRPLKHYKRGYGPGTNVVADSAINIYSPWDSQSKENKMLTIIHELSHNIGSVFKLDESSEWLNFSGWTVKEGTWSAESLDKVPSLYGKSSPYEDFAESVVAYRYNPELLKKIASDKYDFIKKYVFQGIEYGLEEECDPKRSYVEKMIKENQTSDINFPNNLEACQNEILYFFLEKEFNFKECIQKIKKESLISSKLNNSEFNDPRLKNIILKSAKNVKLDFEVSEEEEIKLENKIIESMVNSVRKKFTAEYECVSFSKNAWTLFSEFEKNTLGNNYSGILDREREEKIALGLCQKVQREKRKTLKCQDFEEFFKGMAKKSKIEITAKIDGSCKVDKPKVKKGINFGF